MADDDQRSGPAVEQVLERGQRVDVEIVRRLVEQQHVRLGHHQPHQLEPAPLAARQIGDERPLPVAGEPEALAELRGGQLAAVAERDARAHRLERLEHALAAGELLEVLRERRRAARSSRAARLPRVGSSSPASRRSSVVLPEPLTPTTPTRSPGPSRQVTVRRSRALAERDADALHVEHGLPEARGREPQSSARSRTTGSSAISAFAASIRKRGFVVRAGGPRRSHASSLRSRFRRRPSVTAATRSRSARASTHAAYPPSCSRTVAASISHVRRADGVEEPPIVGHDHERPAPRGEMAREPADGLEVEVVRRLVEQQQLGPVEQQLRERDAAALTTRERADDRVEAAGEARQLDAAERALEHLADPAVARPLVIGKTADHLLPDRRAQDRGCRAGRAGRRADRSSTSPARRRARRDVRPARAASTCRRRSRRRRRSARRRRSRARHRRARRLHRSSSPGARRSRAVSVLPSPRIVRERIRVTPDGGHRSGDAGRGRSQPPARRSMESCVNTAITLAVLPRRHRVHARSRRPPLRPPPSPTNSCNAATAAKVVADTNDYRASLGLSRLTMTPKLNEFALVHARDMAASDNMTHSSSAGLSFAQRARTLVLPLPDDARERRGRGCTVPAGARLVSRAACGATRATRRQHARHGRRARSASPSRPDHTAATPAWSSASRCSVFGWRSSC